MCLAIPGEVREIREVEGLRFARVRFGGVHREVCIDYTPEVGPGDYVLVHVGFAIATVDREEAARTWRALEEIGELGDVEEGPPAEEGKR